MSVRSFDDEFDSNAIIVPADPIQPGEIVSPDVVKSSDPGSFLQTKMQKALLAVQTDGTFLSIIGQAAELEIESRKVEKFVIECVEEERGFVELLGRIEKVEKLAEMRRQELTIFPWRVFQAINRLFKGNQESPGILWGLEKARERVEKPIWRWREKQKKAREEAEKVVKEALLEQEKISAAGAAGAIPLPLPPPPLPDIPQVQNVVQSVNGTKAYYRRGPLDFIAYDKKLLCRAIAEGKVPEECVEVVKGELRKFVKSEQREKREAVIPGVEIVEKDKLVVQMRAEG
jgi:hypothetical protein